MQKTPKSNRLHLSFFGRRNVGKSSLLNLFTRQDVAIVSDVPGTTTDPVEKVMELLPIGPVVLIDTAGLDDSGNLGEKRTAKTRQVFDRTDVGIIVVACGEWTDYEQNICEELRFRNIPVVVAHSKCDLQPPSAELVARLADEKLVQVETSATEKRGVATLREAFVQVVPEDFITTPKIVADLIPQGELAILVVPIDLEAPKGRIILPQVQTIRDILDHDSMCIVVKESELPAALARLNQPPAIVVTDSQAFGEVSKIVPEEVPMTGFSILFARVKGDLQEFVAGAQSIEQLRPGDRILVLEACTHHPVTDDIGREKIPRWLQKYVGGDLEFVHHQGHDFPEDLASFKLVVHCGGCVHNRRAVLSRIARCRAMDIPITNYGLLIAFTHGILERALRPFGLE